MTDRLTEIEGHARRLRSLASALNIPGFQAARLIEIVADIEREIEAARLEGALAAGGSVCIEPGSAQAERLFSIEYDADGKERARFYRRPRAAP